MFGINYRRWAFEFFFREFWMYYVFLFIFIRDTKRKSGRVDLSRFFSTFSCWSVACFVFYFGFF